MLVDELQVPSACLGIEVALEPAVGRMRGERTIPADAPGFARAILDTDTVDERVYHLTQLGLELDGSPVRLHDKQSGHEIELRRSADQIHLSGHTTLLMYKS